MDVFQNYKLRSNITTYSFPKKKLNYMYGLGMVIDSSYSSSKYYALSFGNSKITVFDENWDYLEWKEYSNPFSMIVVNDTFYISSLECIFKTDKYLNLIQKYNVTGFAFSSLYFNSTNNLIYVLSSLENLIYMYTSDLANVVDIISTSPYLPWSMHAYNDRLYVGTDNGTVIVIVDKVIIQTIQVCGSSEDSNLISFILFDDNDYMVPVCFRSNILNLYHANGTFTGTNFTSPTLLTSINFDAKGRFIFTSLYQISIYY